MGEGRSNEAGKVVPFVPELPPGAGAPNASSQPLKALWGYWWRAKGLAMARNSQKAYRRTEELSGALPERPSVHDATHFLSMLPGHQPSTIELRRAHLAALYTWACDMGLSSSNPFRHAGKLYRASQQKLPEIQGGVAELYQRRKEILDSLSDARERAFVAVMGYLGLRQMEALGLKAIDVRRPKGQDWELVVQRQRTRPNEFETDLTKGKRSLALRVRPELRPHLEAVLALGPATLRFGTRTEERTESEVDFLFPFREHDLNDIASRLREKFPECFPPFRRWHQLRRAFAYELTEKGVSPAQGKEAMRHKSAITTEGYYARVRAARVPEGLWRKLDGGEE